MKINRKVFYDYVRQRVFGGHMSQKQVDHVSAILDAWERGYSSSDYRWLAYALATAYHETDRFRQLRERGGRSYFNRYEPGTRIGKRLGNTLKGDGYRFRGAGYSMLTGRRNFRLLGRMIGVDLVANPEAALDTNNAARILLEGMKRGVFTGKKFSDYIHPGGKADYVRARRIINGNDRAGLIAGYARKFATALRMAMKEDHPPVVYAASLTPPEGEEMKPASDPSPAKKPVTKSTSVGNGIAGLSAVAAAFSGFADWKIAAIVAGGAAIVIITLLILRFKRGDLEWRLL